MGAVETCIAPSSTVPALEVSEAQIAVHWREEEYFNPPAKFIEQANASDPAIRKRRPARSTSWSGFKEYADLLTWTMSLAHDTGHEQSSVLEVVRGRPAERVGQLR